MKIAFYYKVQGGMFIRYSEKFSVKECLQGTLANFWKKGRMLKKGCSLKAPCTKFDKIENNRSVFLFNDITI